MHYILMTITDRRSEGQVLHEGRGILQWHLDKINCHQKRQNISWPSWVLVLPAIML